MRDNSGKNKRAHVDRYERRHQQDEKGPPARRIHGKGVLESMLTDSKSSRGMSEVSD